MDPATTAFDIVGFGPSVFYLAGELDLSATPTLRGAIWGAVESGGVLVLDISALRFIDGAGMRVISEALATMPSGCIVVHGAGRTFFKLARVLGIDSDPRLHLLGSDHDPYPVHVSIPEPFHGLRAVIEAASPS
jgi:STAS domain